MHAHCMCNLLVHVVCVYMCDGIVERRGYEEAFNIHVQCTMYVVLINTCDNILHVLLWEQVRT